MIVKRSSSLVSVVIPTYNRKDMLIHAINSARGQTYPVNEIIVVDDASDFEVDTYLKEIYDEACGATLKVIRNQVSQGAAKSRNTGVENAASDFVAFLDSDDYWLPEKIEKQMRVFQTFLDVGLVSCDLFEVDRYGNYLKSNRQLLDSDIWRHLLEGWTSFPNTSSLLFRKDIFVELGGFDSQLTSCQDHDFWMRIGQSGTMVRYVDEGLYVIITEASNRISIDYTKRMKGVHTFLSKWRKDILLYGGEKHLRWYRNNYLVLAAFNILVAKVRNREIREAIEIYLTNFVDNPMFYKKLARSLINKIVPEKHIITRRKLEY